MVESSEQPRDLLAALQASFDQIKERRESRGVSIVPSAEGQRAPYDVQSEEELESLIRESDSRALDLIARMRVRDCE